MEIKQDVGIDRRTAYALSALEIDVVQRSTVRALLPVGATRRKTESAYNARRARGGEAGWSGPNSASRAFQKCLKRYEDWGWIRRGSVLIQILDRHALHAHALDGVQGNAGQAYWLDIERAVSEINAAQRAEDEMHQMVALVEQRRLELRALQRLMEGRRGDNWSGRGSVRLLPRGSTI